MAGVEIYALRDPDNGEVRYIGKANNAAKRLTTHIRDSRVRDNPVHRWIRKLGRDNKLPTITVECVATGDWKDLERQLIAQHRADGARLLNVADGGEEPYCPLEVRRANGFALNRRLILDPVSAALRGVLCTMGQHIRFYESQGDAERLERARATMAKVSAKIKENPELMFARMLAVPRLRKSMHLKDEWLLTDQTHFLTR